MDNADGMRIGFIGDVYLASQIRAPEVRQDLQGLLAACNYVVANLEAPITDIEQPIPKTGASMKQTMAALDLLKLLNVNVVGLGNNHMGDHGDIGISDTIKKLLAAELLFGGAGLFINEVYMPVRLCGDDITITLLFGGENGFGCVSDQRAGECGYAWLFHSLFWNMLKNEVDNSDFVVVFAHGGVEHMHHPLPQWQSAYRQFINAGAAAVIAHHPHLTQACEIYRGAPIFYSIGNFYFNALSPHRYWYHSQIPVLEFKKGRAIGFENHHARFELGGRGRILLDDTEEGLPRTMRLSAELKSPEYPELVAADLRNLWRTSYGPCIDVSFNAFTSIRSLRPFLQRALRSCIRGTSFSNPIMLEALLVIESHRWALTETMRLMRQSDKRRIRIKK